MPWLIRHAAHIITRQRIRDDGRTAYQKMKGRRSNAKLVNFGEAVLFKIPHTQHMPGKFEDKWELGNWVGFVMRTGAHLVGTPKGVFRVSTVRRRPASDRWSSEMLKSISGSPKEPVPGVGSRRIPAFARKFELPQVAKEFVQMLVPEVEVRGAYIYRSDLEAHGPTPGCPGCRAMTDNNRFRAKYNPECRKILEELISQSEG